MKDLYPYSIQNHSSSQVEQAVVDVGYSVEDERRSDLLHYGRALFKRRQLIVVCCLAALVAAAAMVFIATPIYVAESTLLIERKSARMIDIDTVHAEAGGADEYDYYRTQYEILKSQALAAWVIDELGLGDLSLFGGRQDQTEQGLIAGWWGQAAAAASRLFTGSQDAVDAGKLRRLIEIYEDILEIKPIRRTRLVEIAFSTPDADLSAQTKYPAIIKINRSYHYAVEITECSSQ